MTGNSLSCHLLKTQSGFHLLGQKCPTGNRGESKHTICVFMAICLDGIVFTCVVVVVVTVWPSCFRVLGFRREKLSWGPESWKTNR